MAEVAQQAKAWVGADRGEPMLAADIGGTHARIGLVQAAGGGCVQVLAFERYTCAQWTGLDTVIADFLARQGITGPISRCALATTGYVLDEAVVNDNLPWTIALRVLRERLDIGQLDVFNDFEAVAYATQFLDATDTVAVIDPGAPAAEGPVLVMGPGTGMGSAVLLPGEPHPSVLATEAGQIALAPGSEREIEILRLLAAERDYVAVEHALSGPGLCNLYRALCSLRREAPRLEQPTQISQAALAGEDAAAVEALEVFCALLGSFVGDLTMLYGARGGVYLAGGILPQIRDFLLASRFAERFFNKGVMRPFLRQVPVRLMEHGQHGVIGAAGLFLRSRAAAPTIDATTHAR